MSRTNKYERGFGLPKIEDINVVRFYKGFKIKTVFVPEVYLYNSHLEIKCIVGDDTKTKCMEISSGPPETSHLSLVHKAIDGWYTGVYYSLKEGLETIQNTIKTLERLEND